MHPKYITCFHLSHALSEKSYEAGRIFVVLCGRLHMLSHFNRWCHMGKMCSGYVSFLLRGDFVWWRWSRQHFLKNLNMHFFIITMWKIPGILAESNAQLLKPILQSRDYPFELAGPDFSRRCNGTFSQGFGHWPGNQTKLEDNSFSTFFVESMVECLLSVLTLYSNTVNVWNLNSWNPNLTGLQTFLKSEPYHCFTDTFWKKCLNHWTLSSNFSQCLKSKLLGNWTVFDCLKSILRSLVFRQWLYSTVNLRKPDIQQLDL